MCEAISDPSRSAAATSQCMRESDRRAERHRDRERDQPEQADRPSVDPDQRQIELDAGDEHQVEQAELPSSGTVVFPEPIRSSPWDPIT